MGRSIACEYQRPGLSSCELTCAKLDIAETLSASVCSLAIWVEECTCPYGAKGEDRECIGMFGDIQLAGSSGHVRPGACSSLLLCCACQAGEGPSQTHRAVIHLEKRKLTGTETAPSLQVAQESPIKWPIDSILNGISSKLARLWTSKQRD